jgi:hypothetical protein
MTEPHFLFILSYLALFLYIIFKNRRFDFFSILSISLSFYYFSALFSKISIFGVVKNVNILPETHLVLTFIFVTVLLFIFVYDSLSVGHSVQKKIEPNTKLIVNIFTIITIVVFFFGIYNVGGIGVFFSGEKSELATKNTSFYGLSIWLSLVLLSISSYYNFRFYMVFSLALIVFTLLVGSRANIVISFLIISVLVFSKNKITLFRYYKYGMLALLFLFSLVVYKAIYKSVRLADISMVYESLMIINLDVFLGIFMSESSSVVYNLNTVLSQNMELPDYFLYHRLLSFIPMLGEYYESLLGVDIPRFSYFLINDIYDLHFGLASSIFGEWIAIGGFLGMSLFLVTWLLIVTYFNSKLIKGLNIYQLSFVPTIVFSVFYLHRVDITFFVGYLKYAFLICMLIKLILLFISILPLKRAANE